MGERDRDIPSRYRLDSEKGKISLSVPKQTLVAVKGLLPEIAKRFRGSTLPHGFFPYTPDREWGFGPVISEREDPEDQKWIILQTNLPPAISGEVDWDSLYETSATLDVIFQGLKKDESEIDTAIPQMIEVTLFLTGVRGQFNGAHISSAVRPALCEWISQNIGKDRESAIANSMIEAYSRSRPVDEDEKEFYSHRFNARFRFPKWIYLDCPGDATSLSPSSTDIDDSLKTGYRLIPHNVDHPLSQLTLLAGLAKLDRLAVQDYCK